MLDRLKTAMVSRATQIAARVIAYVLACWLGYDVTAEDPTVATYAAAVGAVAMATLDFVIHAVREKQAKDANVPDWWKKLGVLAVLSLPIAGCQQLAPVPTPPTPMQRVTQINATYTSVLASIERAHDLGFMSDRARLDLQQYIDSAEKWRLKLNAAARAGSPDAPLTDFRIAQLAFDEAFDHLLRAMADADDTAAAVKRVNAREPSPVPDDAPVP